MSQYTPTEIKLNRDKRMLTLSFQDGSSYELSCEYLRVFSPSAEVQGHSPEEATLQIGKEHVNITKIEPVGNYAVLLHFDDGHNTGYYTWDNLYHLCTDQEQNWAQYLADLKTAGVNRLPH
ncbi:gamma-butyrobetaine hydroxylase-like domain-containing protein [Pseudomonadota bacterium]